MYKPKIDKNKRLITSTDGTWAESYYINIYTGLQLNVDVPMILCLIGSSSLLRNLNREYHNDRAGREEWPQAPLFLPESHGGWLHCLHRDPCKRREQECPENLLDPWCEGGRSHDTLAQPPAIKTNMKKKTARTALQETWKRIQYKFTVWTFHVSAALVVASSEG